MPMRLLYCAIACLPLLLAVPASGETSPAPQLNCNIGPVAKTYGRTQWLVYSCDDDRSVVIVSASGNPATPAYFMFSPREMGIA